MKKGLIAVVGMVGFLLLTSPQRAVSQNTDTSMKLRVVVKYTGPGKVDDAHKIYVVLWDTPTFVTPGGNPPVDIQAANPKDGVVTFQDVKTVPAYLSSVYDPKGEWDGKSGPPPEGSSLGLYSKTPGKPEPVDIKPGQTASVEFSFDDSLKMPAAQ